MAALKLPVMPFWLVKPSDVLPVTELPLIDTVAPARLVLSASLTVRPASIARRPRCVLGVAQRAAGGHHRRVVDRRDVDRAGRRCAVQRRRRWPVDRRPVPAPKLDGLSLVVGVGDRAQRRLVVGHRGAAGQGQHAGAASKLPVMPFWLVKPSMSAGDEVGADRHRGAGQRWRCRRRSRSGPRRSPRPRCVLGEAQRRRRHVTTGASLTAVTLIVLVAACCSAVPSLAERWSTVRAGVVGLSLVLA